MAVIRSRSISSEAAHARQVERVILRTLAIIDERHATTVIWLGPQHLRQIHQHPRRRAPDVTVRIGEHEEAPEPALVFAAVALAVLGVEDEGQGDLEDL